MNKTNKQFALQIKTNLNHFQDKPIKIKENIKLIYDHLKSDSKLPQGNGLPELIIKNFGAEEIWCQLDTENKSLHLPLRTEVLKLLSTKDQICQEESSEDEVLSEDGNESEMEVAEESDEDGEEEKPVEESDDSDDQEEKDEVTDKFFNLKEMEKFLNNEDKKAMKAPIKNDSDDSGAESDIDLFEATDDEVDDAEIKYKNFFDDPEDQELENEQKDSNEESEEEMSDNEEKKPEEPPKNETTSAFELRQERLKKKIGHLERAALEDKGWQLKGEITANIRPQNSLLEEDLDFDVTARPQLVVTAETNLRLEDIILQRIKDKAWDSVKRKAKPVDDTLEFKKKLALDSEKGKESLAQIYEKEYLKQKEKLEGDDTQKSKEDPPEQIKTTAMINNLFSKLDSLSHFYFTPRLVKPEARIVSNLPAIQMEEVAPVGVSDATLLAPEEIRAKDKAAPIAKDERTKTDKKRERKIKKVKQHKRRLAQEAKEVEKSGKKQSKTQNDRLLKMVTKDRNVQIMEASSAKVGKSSDKFFNNLQDQISNKSGVKRKTKKVEISAKKIKL